MAKKAVIFTALALALAISLQGCYTMIKHPKLDYVDHSTEYYSENCFACHQDLDEYPYGNRFASYPGYWQFYHNWGQYYSYPWWWESYLWDIQIESNDNGYDSYPEGGIDRRRGLFPGDGWQNIPPPNEITGQTQPSGSDSGGGVSTGSNDDGDTKTKDPNSQSEQKDPPKKPERRRLPK